MLNLSSKILAELLNNNGDLAEAKLFNITPEQRQRKEVLVMKAQATCGSHIQILGSSRDLGKLQPFLGHHRSLFVPSKTRICLR